MRFVAIVTLSSALVLVTPCFRASAADEKALDSQAIQALEAKATQAAPKEQCFLYAELAHQMTELAGRQLSAGDEQNASASLKRVEQYAQKIHMGVASDGKKLKNAELLMEHTSFRLKDILNSASYEDRVAMEATLKQLQQVQTELMLQVFKR